MEFTFAHTLPKSPETICVLISEKKQLSDAAKTLDKSLGGMIHAALEKERYHCGRFQGKAKEQLLLSAPVDAPFHHVLLLGTGDTSHHTTHDYEVLGGQIYATLSDLKIKQAAIIVSTEKDSKVPSHLQAAHMAHGAGLRSFSFDIYRTKEKPEDKPKLQKITLVLEDSTRAEACYHPLLAEQAGVFLTREFVSEPPNILYPESMAERCKALKKDGLDVEILGLKQMQKLGMGALLGVAQGSIREPQLVILKWMGDPKGKKEAPVAFIGKGVTFDTGGISLKPAAGMEDMKYDMAGSAVVAGLMRTLALRKAKVNAIGILGLVENMPGHNAQRPSDVVTTMSGQTVEVLNTDAEGRLVLADALWYCQQRFQPKWMVNLATLTGAIVVSLGSEYAGLFSNNDPLAEALKKAGQATDEKLWPFPLGDVYDKMLKSDIADMQNISNERGAGSIIAAQFLKRFVNDVPWAHLDIAGVAWAKKAGPLYGKGATAYGVRLLNRLVADYCE